MPAQRTPFIDLADGDTPGLPLLLERWETPAPQEKIGDFQYSLWKVAEPLPYRIPRFSTSFLIGVPVGILVLLLAGRWAAERTREGDFLPAQVFAISLVAFLYLAPLGVLLVKKLRRARTDIVEESPPGWAPRRAVAFLARSERGGRSVGWLWFDHDLIIFKGVGFDFRLRRSDFATKRPLLKALRSKEGASLNRPKKISSHRLLLLPGAIEEGAFVADPNRWESLESDLLAWEEAVPTNGASLFPPARPLPMTHPQMGWKHWLVPPLFMGALLSVAGLILPLPETPGQARNPPLYLGVVGTLFGLLWPFLLWSSYKIEQSGNREVDKAARIDGR